MCGIETILLFPEFGLREDCFSRRFETKTYILCNPCSQCNQGELLPLYNTTESQEFYNLFLPMATRCNWFPLANNHLRLRTLARITVASRPRYRRSADHCGACHPHGFNHFKWGCPSGKTALKQKSKPKLRRLRSKFTAGPISW